MSAGDAAALVSAGAGQNGDFRSLPTDLQAIDIRSLSTRCVKEAAMSQLIAHIEEVEGACEGADKANKGTLPLSSFLTALKQGKADIPPSMVFPELLCEAGAYRDGLVDYGTFLNHCAVAHDSEVHYMRRGRSEEAQALRRTVLTHKKAIAEKLGAESTTLKLIEVLTGATEPWRMKEQEAQSISSDLSAGAANASDMALQVQKLQFSDFDGELESQCDAIFANYDALVELCKEADADNSGSLSFGSFESAASAASLPADALEATKNCLLREGHSRVPYALLFGSRLRVLTARDLEILDAWRSPKEQASRLVAFNSSEAIARSLGMGGSLVDEGKVRSELEANGVSDASVVLKALPRGEGGQISADADATETVMFRGQFLSEAAASNVWVVKDGTVLGPKKNHLVLEGVRYDLLAQLCQACGLDYALRDIERDEVWQADELLLTSATKEVLAITSLDGHAVGHTSHRGQPGPVYAQLYKAYQRAKYDA